MHLLTRAAGALQQEGEAIDLGQSPAPIIFASAADSELVMLAAAADRAGARDLRLANLLRLGHNLSVDLWLDQTVRHARLVVVRLLGGPAYWPYGVDELTALRFAGGPQLVLLPGDATPDPILQQRSSIAAADWAYLHALFTAGGPDNADAVLAMFRRLTAPAPPSALRGGIEGGGGAGDHRWTPTPSPSPQGGGESAGAGGGTVDGNTNAMSAAPAPPSPVREGIEGGGGSGDHGWTPTPSPSPQGGGERVGAGGGAGDASPAPRPFPRFGHYHPQTGLTPERVAGLARAPMLPSPLRGGAGGGGPATDHRADDAGARPIIPIIFYRAALEGAGTATVDALIAALDAAGLEPLPLVVSTLKEAASIRFVQQVLASHLPAVILNLTGFALGIEGLEPAQNPFAAIDVPVIQLIQAGRSAGQWRADPQGLTARDLAMQVVLPELDGRHGMLLVGHKEEARWHAGTECLLTSYAPDPDGIARAVALAGSWARLRQTPRADRRVAIVLANYPIRDGRLANGVGYDAPQSTVAMLRALRDAGYSATTSAELTVEPSSAAALMAALQAGPTNAHPERGEGIAFPLARYRALFAALPDKLRAEVAARWGDPAADPFVRGDTFHLPALRFGNIAVLLQPARGYHLDEQLSYHDPDLVPPHGYLAAYLWLRHEFSAHALIHNGKHGNLEWLPGKATALGPADYPAALWAELPQLYPFIVNDPGEGSQAKRRTGAVIIDHLVPPLTRAETYGPLKELEALLDEYYAAAGMDRRRLAGLRRRILDFAADARLDRDAGLGADPEDNLQRLDNFLCELKEAQIRDGLHVFGQSPTGRLERDLTIALARVPRGEGAGNASLLRALADDLKLGFDPLTAELGARWTGPALDEVAGSVRRAPPPPASLVPLPRSTGEDHREIVPQLDPPPQRGGGELAGAGGGDGDWNANAMPAAPAPPSPLRGGIEGGGGADDHRWTPTPSPSPQGGGEVEGAVRGAPRTVGQVVERLEELAAALLEGRADAPGPATGAVLATIADTIRPRLAASGPAEMAALLDGLDGKFVRPGPSGAPSRGRLDVLPTGRNFYSVDNRAVPTPTAWELGQKSAENLLLRHFQDHGSHLAALALSVWGTANMRTGGDDIAQALAFIGAKPVWDPGSLRISGYEIVPLARLGRPRVDVTLRISGFFRDAFPAQIALFDKAVRAIGALDEPEDHNPIAATMRREALGLMAEGASEAEAALKAGHRIFGSKPGAYGAGLQGLIDTGRWTDPADLAEAFLDWGQYAYGAHAAGTPERGHFMARLSNIEAIVHNQDNREHDLLDSDDYYQFEGGLAVTAAALTGRRPAAYHNDHSRPERPLARTLEEEIARVMRSRVVNPKWIDGVKRHGYKGAFEIIATVDYMFAFAVTTGAVKTHHFDLAFEAFVADEATRNFIRDNNRFGYDELIAKFDDARRRGFWTPRSNAAFALLEDKR